MFRDCPLCGHGGAGRGTVYANGVTQWHCGLTIFSDENCCCQVFYSATQGILSPAFATFEEARDC